MASKVKKAHTYIVLTSSTSGTHRVPQGRYKVGAKNEKNAEELLRKEIGLLKVRVYYKQDKDELEYGQIIREC